MGRIDQLILRYQRHLEMPLRPNLPLSQRVWFLVYPPDEERRIIGRIPEFEMATDGVGLHWKKNNACVTPISSKIMPSPDSEIFSVIKSLKK
jgi:hypothetical protein